MPAIFKKASGKNDANKMEKGTTEQSERESVISIPSEGIKGANEMPPRYTYLSAFLRTLTPEDADPHVVFFEQHKNAGDVTKPETKKGRRSHKLGTIFGVFLPSIEHVFGVIMFLRLPWIVGIMGVPEAFFMTFLTTLAIGAITTNGRIGTGGPYYLISRSLGPGAGAAIGLLFCAANTIAVAMYIIGGVEIVLIYLAPEAAIHGRAAIAQTGWFESMTNSMRLYGAATCLLVLVVVLLGIRVTQAIAPMSLIGLGVGITCIYIGAIQKTAQGGSGPYVCQVGGRLVKWEAYIPKDQWRTRQPSLDDCQLYCTASRIDVPLFGYYCVEKDKIGQVFDDPRKGCSNKDRVARDFLVTDKMNNVTKIVTYLCLPYFTPANTSCVRGTPGLSASVLEGNVEPKYLSEDETEPGTMACRHDEQGYIEVFQDISTSFFLLLNIYFPSVTGICTGANMSGDLKDPQRSVPWGTMAAQLVTSGVYLSYVLIFGSSTISSYLRDKYGYSVGGSMAVAYLGWPHPKVIIVASFMSTLGASIQSLCSAPKLLQAIAQDNVLPALGIFARTTRNEPLIGQITLGAVALCFVLIGKLDFIAPIVEKCFLCCYAGLNLSCLLSSAVAAPSWRPRFKLYHPLLSAVGFLLSIFLMCVGRWIDRVCLLIGIGILLFVVFRGSEIEFGDALGGLKQTIASLALFVTRRDYSVTNCWRPRIHIMAWDVETLKPLVELAAHLKFKRHALALISLMQATPSGTESLRRHDGTQRNELLSIAAEHRFSTFVKLYRMPPAAKGSAGAIEVDAYVRMSSLGPLRTNCVLVTRPPCCPTARMNRIMYKLVHCPITLLVAHGISADLRPSQPTAHLCRVDVWWILEHGDLLVALARLFTRQSTWKNAEINLFVVMLPGDNDVENAVEHVIRRTKLNVTAYIVQHTCRVRRRWLALSQKGVCPGVAKRQLQTAADKHRSETNHQAVYELARTRKLNELMLKHSAKSSLLIANIPAPPRSSTLMPSYIRYVNALFDKLPKTLLVRGTDTEVIKH